MRYKKTGAVVVAAALLTGGSVAAFSADGAAVAASEDSAFPVYSHGTWTLATGQYAELLAYRDAQHRTPRWLLVKQVPERIRRELHIRGPAVMLVAPLTTVIMIRDEARVPES